METSEKETFSASELRYLGSLEAVRRVTPKRIYYTDAFRDEVVRRYRRGERPVRIFRDHGLDPMLIGHKRVERATERWLRDAQPPNAPAAHRPRKINRIGGGYQKIPSVSNRTAAPPDMDWDLPRMSCPTPSTTFRNTPISPRPWNRSMPTRCPIIPMSSICPTQAPPSAARSGIAPMRSRSCAARSSTGCFPSTNASPRWNPVCVATPNKDDRAPDSAQTKPNPGRGVCQPAQRVIGTGDAR